MQQYLLTVNHVEGDEPPPSDEIEQIFKDVDAVNDDLKKQGAWVFAGGLHPPSTSTVVQIRDGEVLTIDGPFAETKEYIGGFWIIQTADLDEALVWGAKATAACRLPVEIRPFQEEPEE